MMEAVNWACTRVEESHEWVSEFSLRVHENRILGNWDFDAEVPGFASCSISCVVSASAEIQFYTAVYSVSDGAPLKLGANWTN